VAIPGAGEGASTDTDDALRVEGMFFEFEVGEVLVWHLADPNRCAIRREGRIAC
jgi:hypothetical protein